jgi:hypothetical protein
MHHLQFAAVGLLACVHAKPLVTSGPMYFPFLGNVQKPRAEGLAGACFLYPGRGNSNCSGTELVSISSTGASDLLECIGIVSGNGKQEPLFSILVIPDSQIGWTVQFFNDSSCVQPQGDPILHCGLVCVAPPDGFALSANFKTITGTSVSQTLPISTNSSGMFEDGIIANVG